MCWLVIWAIASQHFSKLFFAISKVSFIALCTQVIKPTLFVNSFRISSSWQPLTPGIAQSVCRNRRVGPQITQYAGILRRRVAVADRPSDAYLSKTCICRISVLMAASSVVWFRFLALAPCASAAQMAGCSWPDPHSVILRFYVTEKHVISFCHIDANTINSSHIFRAIMGVYFAMVVFWILGARKSALTLPAL